MSTFANFTSPVANGPTRRPSAMINGASASATLSVCWIAKVFGVTSANTNNRMVMPTVAMSSPAPSNCRIGEDDRDRRTPDRREQRQEQDHVQVGRWIVRDLREGRGASATILPEAVGTHTVDPRDRDLGRAQDTDRQDQQEDDDELEPVRTAHGTRTPL